jgi:hypothetical protein
MTETRCEKTPSKDECIAFDIIRAINVKIDALEFVLEPVLVEPNPECDAEKEQSPLLSKLDYTFKHLN